MFQLNKAEVYRGQPAQFALVMVDAAGRQLPTCGLTGVVVLVQNEDDTFTEKAPDGVQIWGYGEQTNLYVFSFTDAETPLFKLGAERSVYVKIAFTTGELKFEFKKCLTVLEEIV